MKGLLGCILFRGAMKQNMLPTTIIWDVFYGQGLVCVTMSHNRFSELLACMHFNDKNSRSSWRASDTFAPFRDFWCHSTENLHTRYIPEPFVTVDEQLVPFRGHCSFIQYLPSKPDHYGIKIFWAADAETNYPLVAEPYLGRPLWADWEVNLGQNIALKLSSCFANTGWNITCDQKHLLTGGCQTLLSQGPTFLDTVRANKRFLPESFQAKKGQALHESTFVFDGKTTLVNYQTKYIKNVVVLSTMHHDTYVDLLVSKRKQREQQRELLMLLTNWLMHTPANESQGVGRWYYSTTVSVLPQL